ncbi:MAG: tetratricopeptide repeat protein [Phaeodactylibacter sp.]|nr:tetratricopeptide repeat protein [Phaeodactylibacter sp.]MCB9293202.1 tetratricopeptide repeat protein [Lewinellaceae bacterium]
MTKLQWAVIASAVGMFFLIYLGCETTPENIKALEKSRALAAESTDINTLLQDARSTLDNRASGSILALETELEKTPADSARAEVFKRLASKWYELGHPAISGYYAQQVAELAGGEEAWSIAGTTYTICVQQSQEQKTRDFCTGRAVQAFENAISLNPQETAHQVNLALAYASNPPPDNPMKGILMLRDLNQKDPDNVLVLNTLARLAIQTGQYPRAVERLERALSLEPDNSNTICLLAEAYRGSGETEKAEAFAGRCRSLQR